MLPGYVAGEAMRLPQPAPRLLWIPARSPAPPIGYHRNKDLRLVDLHSADVSAETEGQKKRREDAAIVQRAERSDMEFGSPPSTVNTGSSAQYSNPPAEHIWPTPSPRQPFSDEMPRPNVKTRRQRLYCASPGEEEQTCQDKLQKARGNYRRLTASSSCFLDRQPPPVQHGIFGCRPSVSEHRSTAETKPLCVGCSGKRDPPCAP